MSGAITPLLLYAIMAWKRITFLFHLQSVCVIDSEDTTIKRVTQPLGTKAQSGN
jgi:hypothetical protein